MVIYDNIFVLWKYRLKCLRVKVQDPYNLLLNSLEKKKCIYVYRERENINVKTNEAKLIIGKYE